MTKTEITWSEPQPKADEADPQIALRARYLTRLAERISVLEKLFEKISNTDLKLEERQALLEVAHKLAGNGATYGFAGISEAAHKLETLIADDKPPLAHISVQPHQSSVTEAIVDTSQLLETIIAQANTNGFDAVAEAADDLKSRLEKPISTPRKMVIAQLQNLIDSCREAVRADPETTPPEDTPTPAEIDISRDPRRTVLIVDDDPDVRIQLKSIISAFAVVVEGKSAREAYVQMKRRKPDLVLLDNEMPGDASGARLLARLKDRAGVDKIPVVMISAHCSEDEIAQARQSGAVDFIAKPFDAFEVGERIKRRLFRLGKHVLVVDDDPAICAVLTEALSAAGFTVTEAWDGRLALDKMTQTPPDLVVLDWRLPGLSGDKILQAMQADEKLVHIPVFLITALNLSSIEVETTADIAFVPKPFSMDTIVARCAAVLDFPPNSDQ